MRPLLCGAVLAAGLTLSAGADPTSDARTAIQAFYDAASRGAEHLDLSKAKATRRPGYSYTSIAGLRQNETELTKSEQEQMKKTIKCRCWSKITEFQVEGKRAYVLVKEHYQGELRRSWVSPGPKNVIVDDTAQDVWMKDSSGWRMASSMNLDDHVVLDGKKSETHVGYVRVIHENGHPSAMETAITRFASKSGQTVDLVGVVHVGEASYYRELNKDLATYQAVLYELVAPHSMKGKKRLIPQRNEKADNPLSEMQLGLTRMLGLEFQLNEVDYSPANFVHADVSPEELLASMTRRKESFQSMFLSMMRESLKNSSDIDAAEGLRLEMSLTSMLLRGPNKEDQRNLRRVMANSFRQIEEMTEGMGGPDGSTLITVRNQYALKVMQRELAAGKRRLAIFYGAGHMADIEKQLVKRGFRRQRVTFLKAWDLN